MYVYVCVCVCVYFDNLAHCKFPIMIYGGYHFISVILNKMLSFIWRL